MTWGPETRKRLEEIVLEQCDPEITDPDEYERDLQCIAAALAELDRRGRRIKELLEAGSEAHAELLTTHGFLAPSLAVSAISKAERLLEKAIWPQREEA